MALKIRLSAAVATIAFSPNSAVSQQVTTDWLFSAAVACGGGQDIMVQQEFESDLVRQVETTSSSEINLAGFLDRFLVANPDLYDSYVECISGLAALSMPNSGLTGDRILLDSTAPKIAPITTLEHGQRYLIREGETVALFSWDTMLTAKNSSRNNHIDFIWTNSTDGSVEGAEIEQGEFFSITDSCRIVAYQINVSEGNASLLVNCPNGLEP